jgi:long-chain fatty acid transport protein
MKRRTTTTRALAVALLGAALGGEPAAGAGFSIYEQGARGMGFAGAYTAQTQDPSAIFHNAAGIAFLTGSRLYLGGTLVKPSTDFAGADPFPGQGRTETGDVSPIPVPAAYFTHALRDGLVLGVGVHAPFGLRTQWKDPDAYSGRYLSTLADLKGVSVNPTLAFKLADRLALGVGLDVRFNKVRLERRVPGIHPFTQRVVDIAEVALESDTATGLGFNVGMVAKPAAHLAFGLSYRHKVNVDLEGAATFRPRPTGNSAFDALVASRLPAGAEPLTTSVEFPAVASGGLAWTAGDWTVAADAVFFQWSTFDRLNIVFVNRPDLSSSTPEDYRNSWQYRFGVERRLSETWAVRGGYFYDESPSPPASVTPLLPDASRHGFALGGTFRRGRFHLDVGSWYLRGKERSTEGQNHDQYNGTYKSKAVTFGASLGLEF